MDIADFSLDLFSLGGRNALVTGGNTGLGRAFSVALAKAGADVFAVGLAGDDGTTRRLVEGAGRRFEFAVADITQPGVPASTVNRCVDTLGSVDILVNSAGIALLADVEEFGRDLWDPMVSVNLTAAFELAHEASRFMIRQRSGKIINVASLFSFLGGKRSPAYAATKAGIAGFTKAYCDELATHNIQVNAIAPGYFKTAITEAARADPETERRIVEHIPAARWGETADLMGATVFLASRASDYVNGHILVVDGGYLVRLPTATTHPPQRLTHHNDATETATETQAMAPSRSPLNRQSIAAAMTELLGPHAVDTSDQQLKEASVDRFKKYTSVHGIYDGPIPAAIVYPESTADVAAVLRFADENLVNVVPRTGRTATEGGLETVVEDSLVVDGSRMNAILSIDPVDMMASVQCGVRLQNLEDTVREQGLTTGHSPQSKPLAQLGGLVATRSIGQFSTLYGGIEDMVVGLEAVFPGGQVTRIKNVPRRAAGPDIRHIVIGSEGALCFITEVTVRLFRYQPENNRYFGFLVDEFADGIDALRELITAGYRPSVCRVYSPEDARQHFADFYQGKNVVVFVAEGSKGLTGATAEAIEELFAARPHERVEGKRIQQWFENLNWGQDKIDAEKAAMLEHSHLGFTTEVSVNWTQVSGLFDAVMARIRREFPRAGDLTMLGAHSSHSYQTGTNLYFVYDYTINCSPREEIEVYHKPLNAIIVTEALKAGGSMVHHHGIGKYRTPWVRQEHGSAYYLLSTLKHAFDPNGVMNAGTIFPLET